MRLLSVFVALAPFLSFVDAVEAAPAGAIVAGVARDVTGHRRAIVDIPESPWHRRSKRQVDINAPVNNAPTDETPVEGPPATVTVTGLSTSDSSTSTSSTSTSTSTSTDSSSTSTSTSTESSSSSTSTDSSSTSTSTESSSSSTSTSSSDTTTSSESSSTPAPTDPPSSSTSTSSSTEDPTLVLPTLSIPTIDLPTISLPTISVPDITPTITTTESFPPPDSTTSTPIGTDPGTPGPPTSTSTSTPIPTDPPTSTFSTTSSPVFNVTDVFPTTTESGIDTPTITLTETSTTRPPITIDSQYQFLTASSFIIAPALSTSTASLTISDPDAPLTSVSLVQGGSATTLVIPAVPSSVPLYITPPASADPVNAGTDIPGFTEINILFQPTARWTFVLQSSDTAAQILAYVPEIIKAALQLTNPDDVKTVGLKAFQPATYTKPDDLLTIWDGYIPTDQVATLAAMIRAANSQFYNLDDSVARSVAKNIDGSYNIATISGVSNTNGGNSTASNSGSALVDNSRRNAIIGVSVAFGLVALAVLVWWMRKTYKAKQEGMHKRLSYDGQVNYGAAGTGVAVDYERNYGFGANAEAPRAESPPNLHNPFMTEREREEEARGIRRNSFYAIGPDDASIEEETFDYMSQRSSNGGLNRAGSGGHGGWLTVNNGNNAAGRRPVVGQPISQPILRESSMGNW